LYRACEEPSIDVGDPSLKRVVPTGLVPFLATLPGTSVPGFHITPLRGCIWWFGERIVLREWWTSSTQEVTLVHQVVTVHTGGDQAEQ